MPGRHNVTPFGLRLGSESARENREFAQLRFSWARGSGWTDEQWSWDVEKCNERHQDSARSPPGRIFRKKEGRARREAGGPWSSDLVGVLGGFRGRSVLQKRGMSPLEAICLEGSVRDRKEQKLAKFGQRKV